MDAKHRQMLIFHFCLEAGKLLGSLQALYPILYSENLPVDDLAMALTKLRQHCHPTPDELN